MKPLKVLAALLLCGTLTTATAQVQYVLTEADGEFYDATEKENIERIASEKGWSTPSEWNYVYNKVAFVGWYDTAEQFLAADDVDDDEKAACEWALRQGATYIPTTMVIDLSKDLSMFDALWLHVDFDESALPRLKDYYNNGTYSEAEKALLDEGLTTTFGTLDMPEGGVHRNTAAETTEADYLAIEHILAAHTAGSGEHAVGVRDAMFGPRFIASLKLRHQLGWNLLLTMHASFLISSIDRYSYVKDGVRQVRKPRRWNFKKGAMVDREGYAVTFNPTTNAFDAVTDATLSVAYGHLGKLWSNGFYQDWPGTIDMSRVGVDYERINKALNGGEYTFDNTLQYLTEPTRQDMSHIAERSNDNNYLTWFARFFDERIFTPSRQNANVYRAMAFNTVSGVKVDNDADFPNYRYDKADQYDPKFLKTITLFPGADQYKTSDTYQAGDPVYDIWESRNSENHNAYFAIDRSYRDDINHDDNTETFKWRDLYVQSSMEPLATRADIADYCMGTLIRWYPTNQSWRNNTKDNNVVLPNGSDNINVDELDTFRGRAFTLGAPGYEWNPGQTFSSWYATQTPLTDNNNGYSKPFDPALYQDLLSDKPADATLTDAARAAAASFTRGNIEQLTHNLLYELVRKTFDIDDDPRALSPIAEAAQLLTLTDAGRACLTTQPVGTLAITYSPDNTTLLVAYNAEDVITSLSVLTAADLQGYDSVQAFIANPANVLWTTDYYVATLDATANADKLQNAADLNITVAVAGTEGSVTAVKTAIEGLEKEVYGALVRRHGTVAAGMMEVTLDYRSVNPDYRRSASEITSFSPVLPKPYAAEGEYSVVHDPADTFTFDTDYLQFEVPSTASDGASGTLLLDQGHAPRHLNYTLRFTRPNISAEIARANAIAYTVAATVGQQPLESVNGEYVDNSGRDALKPYTLALTNLLPAEQATLTMAVTATEYRPLTGGTTPLTATYGHDLTHSATHTLKRESASIDAIYFGLLAPGATYGDVTNNTEHYYGRYNGHLNYTQTGHINVADTDQAPHLFMFETIHGDKFSLYPYLVEHHDDSTTDRLAGTYIAHGIAAEAIPTIVITPVYIFDTDTRASFTINRQAPTEADMPRRAAETATPAPMRHIWDTPEQADITIAATTYAVVKGEPVRYTGEGSTTGIESISDADIVAETWHTLSGIAVSAPTSAGIYLHTTVHADGTHRISKTIVTQ